MSLDTSESCIIKINDKQRAILTSALLTYICEGGFQNSATPEDIAEAQTLHMLFEKQNMNLAEGYINNLRP